MKCANIFPQAYLKKKGLSEPPGWKHIWTSDTIIDVKRKLISLGTHLWSLWLNGINGRGAITQCANCYKIHTIQFLSQWLLVACTRLNNPLCMCRSVGPSSIIPSIGQLVTLSFFSVNGRFPCPRFFANFFFFSVFFFITDPVIPHATWVGMYPALFSMPLRVSNTLRQINACHYRS